MTYSCVDVLNSRPPRYVSQHTDLWDVAPLLPQIPNEASFHTLIPQLYEYNYAKLKNSSLTCIGNIDTIHGVSVVDLFNAESFVVHLQQTINPPENPKFNIDWAHSTSEDLKWDVYRVVTTGGAVPTSCDGQNESIELDYAAEYWFYHY